MALTGCAKGVPVSVPVTATGETSRLVVPTIGNPPGDNTLPGDKTLVPAAALPPDSHGVGVSDAMDMGIGKGVGVGAGPDEVLTGMPGDGVDDAAKSRTGHREGDGPAFMGEAGELVGVVEVVAPDRCACKAWTTSAAVGRSLTCAAIMDWISKKRKWSAGNSAPGWMTP